MRKREEVWPWNITITCPNCEARVRPKYEDHHLFIMEVGAQGRYIFLSCPNCATRLRDYESWHAKAEELDNPKKEEPVPHLVEGLMPVWFWLGLGAVALVWLWFLALHAYGGW